MDKDKSGTPIASANKDPSFCSSVIENSKKTGIIDNKIDFHQISDQKVVESLNSPIANNNSKSEMDP